MNKPTNTGQNIIYGALLCLCRPAVYSFACLSKCACLGGRRCLPVCCTWCLSGVAPAGERLAMACARGTLGGRPEARAGSDARRAAAAASLAGVVACMRIASRSRSTRRRIPRAPARRPRPRRLLTRRRRHRRSSSSINSISSSNSRGRRRRKTGRFARRRLLAVGSGIRVHCCSAVSGVEARETGSVECLSACLCLSRASRYSNVEAV